MCAKGGKGCFVGSGYEAGWFLDNNDHTTSRSQDDLERRPSTCFDHDAPQRVNVDAAPAQCRPPTARTACFVFEELYDPQGHETGNGLGGRA
jgi:hypothetical protein